MAFAWWKAFSTKRWLIFLSISFNSFFIQSIKPRPFQTTGTAQVLTVFIRLLALRLDIRNSPSPLKYALLPVFFITWFKILSSSRTLMYLQLLSSCLPIFLPQGRIRCWFPIGFHFLMVYTTHLKILNSVPISLEQCKIVCTKESSYCSNLEDDLGFLFGWPFQDHFPFVPFAAPWLMELVLTKREKGRKSSLKNTSLNGNHPWLYITEIKVGFPVRHRRIHQAYKIRSFSKHLKKREDQQMWYYVVCIFKTYSNHTKICSLFYSFLVLVCQC